MRACAWAGVRAGGRGTQPTQPMQVVAAPSDEVRGHGGASGRGADRNERPEPCLSRQRVLGGMTAAELCQCAPWTATARRSGRRDGWRCARRCAFSCGHALFKAPRGVVGLWWQVGQWNGGVRVRVRVRVSSSAVGTPAFVHPRFTPACDRPTVVALPGIASLSGANTRTLLPTSRSAGSPGSRIPGRLVQFTSARRGRPT